MVDGDGGRLRRKLMPRREGEVFPATNRNERARSGFRGGSERMRMFV